LSLERGTLLDNILRMKEARKGMWESIRKRLAVLDPPIDADATELGPVLDEIEARLAEYIAPSGEGRSTRLFVSQLTREHLRKTIAFFLTMGRGEEAVPFQQAGSGTLNTLLLALLTFIADLKKDNVIFAMEEPEIALPPHTQRRIANYLLEETSQCFVTSHSPYVIERFEPEGIVKLNRDDQGELSGVVVKLPAGMKAKNYRQNFRRAIAEAAYRFSEECEAKDRIVVGLNEYIEKDVILHSKVILVDGKLSVIGSVNLNQRSFIHDLENAVLIYSPDFHQEMSHILDSYRKTSKPVSEKQKIKIKKQ
jgi:hypothetical protein